MIEIIICEQEFNGRRRKKKKKEEEEEEEEEEKIWIAELKASELVHLRCENKLIFVSKFMDHLRIFIDFYCKFIDFRICRLNSKCNVFHV